MDCCEACLGSTALPDFCPVSLNVCGHYLADGAPGHVRRRLHGRGEGLSGQPPGCQRTSHQTSPNFRAYFTSSKLPTAPGDQGLSSACPPTRISTSGDGDGGSGHPIPPSRSSGNPAVADPGDWEMEGDGTEELCPSPSQTTPLLLPNTGTGDKDGTVCPHQTRRLSLDESSRDPDGDSRRNLELYGLGLGPEKTGTHSQERHPDGQDAGVHSGAERTLTGSKHGVTVQEPETLWTKPGHTSHSMAFAGDDEKQPDLGAALPFGSQQCLATSPRSPSPSPEQNEPIGRDLSEELERKVLTSEAARATLSLRLANPHGVTCYVNANLQAFIWGSLQREHTIWADFGAAECAIQELLMPRREPIYALGLPGFASLGTL